jgi:hypothetical protein
MSVRQTILWSLAGCFVAATVMVKPAAAQESSSFECVERPKGVRPPPRGLPSLRHAGKHEPGERDDDDRKDRDKDQDKERKQEAGASPVSTLHFKPVCPEFRVPVSKMAPYRGPKGNPLFASDPTEEVFRVPDQAEFVRSHLLKFEEVYGRPKPPADDPPCDGKFWYGACFYYGSAGFEKVADGAGMTQAIEKPAYVNVDGSLTQGHTLDEVAVMDGNSIVNTVELGWFVSRDVYGDDDPHIFVYHWVQGAQTCYDDCGWQQYSNTYAPQMNLGSAVGKQVYIGYVFFEGNWWAWFDDQWMGFFPGSLWNNSYNKTGNIQWFGEVSSLNGIPPQTQMGNGQFPGVSTAASMTTLCDVDAKAWVCWYRDQQNLGQTPPNPKYYGIQRTGFGATRYGGPGH